eukprot:SAG25_NODE_30_length_20554_cov_36.028694_20_plen_351_part_00
MGTGLTRHPDTAAELCLVELEKLTDHDKASLSTVAPSRDEAVVALSGRVVYSPLENIETSYSANATLHVDTRASIMSECWTRSLALIVCVVDVVADNGNIWGTSILDGTSIVLPGVASALVRFSKWLLASDNVWIAARDTGSEQVSPVQTDIVRMAARIWTKMACSQKGRTLLCHSTTGLLPAILQRLEVSCTSTIHGQEIGSCAIVRALLGFVANCIAASGDGILHIIAAAEHHNAVSSTPVVCGVVVQEIVSTATSSESKKSYMEPALAKRAVAQMLSSVVGAQLLEKAGLVNTLLTQLRHGCTNVDQATLALALAADDKVMLLGQPRSFRTIRCALKRSLPCRYWTV